MLLIVLPIATEWQRAAGVPSRSNAFVHDVAGSYAMQHLLVKFDLVMRPAAPWVPALLQHLAAAALGLSGSVLGRPIKLNLRRVIPI